MEAKRKVIIAGNWKMNHGPEAAANFFKATQEAWPNSLSDKARDQIANGQLIPMIFPPMLTLPILSHSFGGGSIVIGSQNTHYEESGAYTGEVSAPMLKEIGVGHTLVGHSERRQYFGETNLSTAKRTHGLLSQNIDVMLCIGETLEEREANRTQDILREQIEAVLNFESAVVLDQAFLSGRLTLAYEPVWAIGTGKTATPEQAEEAHQMIRKLIWDRLGMEAASHTHILYGGSVKPGNIDKILTGANVDGALVGGASLKPDDFTQLIESGAKALS